MYNRPFLFQRYRNCYDELRWTDFGFPSLRKRGESTFIEAYQNGAADAQSEEIGRTRLGRCIRSQNWPWLARSILWRWTEWPPNRLGYLGIRHLSRFYRQEGSTTTAPRSNFLPLSSTFYRLKWWRASALDGRFRHRRKRVGEFFTQSVDKSMQERFLLASSGISIGHLGGMNELLIVQVEHSIVRLFLFLISW